ncbi:uncharacterized protein FIBRA_01729 [Fibroporia radiculosa]|uniref:Uncharacterized protein n=1 Tax=Fibroporia radiculosa TaxID=599839 RepID=J4HTT0_9APHY|nr:uncharacterized protein FIBRA_01729 [Fibroporia radiculosa]CCL99707.1 predicted protein [Fibroporia radiculosa]
MISDQGVCPTKLKRPPVNTFDALLVRLEQLFPSFNSVILVQEAISEQFFFVNLDDLKKRCGLSDCSVREDLNDRHQWPLFIQLRETPTLLWPPPKRLSQVLSELLRYGEEGASAHRGAAILSLDSTDAVPLAAFLLDYPVAYVPASADQTSFLADVSLDVYECVFRPGVVEAQRLSLTNGEHIVMKFSCPSAIYSAEEVGELSAPKLTQRLSDKFGNRLREAGLPDSFLIRHTTQVHDRVSL